MLFNSIDFMIFFPVVTAVYFVIPRRIRYIWLLAASYYFYMSWNPRYVLLIILSTMITYASGIFIEKAEGWGKGKKIWMAGCIIGNLGILCVFKYANFLLSNIGRTMSFLGIGVINRRVDLLLPVGISFYTFQALSYTIDVYRGKVKAEKNIFKYALFVSFFPQLVAGPIERSKNLLHQIQNIEQIKVWNFERIRDGFLLMMWGLFQKLVIADRASILVDHVINQYWSYGFLEISLAMILFAIQIYCDFDGYTNIARGAAKVMGFSLMKNFQQPYLAVSVKDFWRRWHISLTSWFTDYLYIPLGGNRVGTLRKYANILIVFAVSGLWHGASWNFIVWGVLHALYQIAGEIKGGIFQKKDLSDTSCSSRVRKAVTTFLLVDFAWIFFVCDSLRHALDVIRQMLTKFRTTTFDLGLNRANWSVLIFGIAVMVIVDVLHERDRSVFAVFHRQEFWFRCVLYVGLIWAVILFGIYGAQYDAGDFIYFQF
ncbi:MAG: MBOAT family protein [Clostridium sp.]|nr:MBOAT family protein [Clostridium sp.]